MKGKVKVLLILAPAILYGLFMAVMTVLVTLTPLAEWYFPLNFFIVFFLMLSWLTVLIPCAVSANAHKKAAANPEQAAYSVPTVAIANITGLVLYCAMWGFASLSIMTLPFTVEVFCFILTPVVVFVLQIVMTAVLTVAPDHAVRRQRK